MMVAPHGCAYTPDPGTELTALPTPISTQLRSILPLGPISGCPLLMSLRHTLVLWWW